MDKPTPTVFLKARSVALCCLVIINSLWIILLCLLVFTRWDVSNHPQRTLLIMMLVTNTLSAVIILILLLVEFRPWLDAARVALLLIIHIGTASAFVVWSPKFECLTQTLDQEGVCKLIIIYILIASWLVPALLIVYATGLAIMVWKRSLSVIPTTDSFYHEEISVQVQRPSAAVVTDKSTYLSRSTIPPYGLEPFGSKASLISNDGEGSLSQVIPGKRLSKPSPLIYY